MTMKLDMRLGDCLDVLPQLAAGSVHCCVCSPPYWGLRDYGVEGQLGLEATPEEYVAKMVEVFAAVRRVLRDDGTLWLNLGDCYAQSGYGQGGGWAKPEADDRYDSQKGKRSTFRDPGFKHGMKPKDLVGIPWMVAFALRADGWYLRSDIIWHKPNPMPESCTDRPTKSHEYLFLLTKSKTYFYDADAIREPMLDEVRIRREAAKGMNDCIGQHWKLDASRNDVGKGMPNSQHGARIKLLDQGGRNKRSVWTIPEEEWAQFLEWKAQQVQQKPDVWKIPTHAFPGAHFATFPPNLVRPCILAGTSEEGCCAGCGAPWERTTDVEQEILTGSVGKVRGDANRQPGERNDLPVNRTRKHVTTTGWQPTCTCDADTVPCTVLDPFLGSGTAAKVSQQYGRSFVGCELSPEYLELARDRFNQPRLFS